MAFDTDGLQEALDAGRTLGPAAVGSQILIMSVASFVTLIVFNVLRPRNQTIYEPKVKYHADSKPPPNISRSIFGWLPPLIHTKEPELLDKIGFDAVAFLRFLRLLRTLFTGIAVLACCILIPVNVSYNNSHIDPAKRDLLSITTMRDVKGNTLYAHVTVSYLITIFIVVVVYIYWRDMVQLRKDWFRSSEHLDAFYARTLRIRNVPVGTLSDEGIQKILDRETSEMRYKPTSVHIGRSVGRLPELIEEHNQTVRDFEAVLFKHFKGKERRAASGKDLERPTMKMGGCCGLGGLHRDAIVFYTAKLKRTEAAVKEYRSNIGSKAPERYGFASLAAVPYAHIVAKKLHQSTPMGTTISLAPNPKDIIWKNMNKSDTERGRTETIGWWWLIIICFLSLIPLLIVAILANLDAVASTGFLPFLSTWSKDHAVAYAIVSGVLPPAVSGIFTFFLPRIMRWLAQYSGALTHAHLDRAVAGRYFGFLVISQLIIFTLIGVIFNSISHIVSVIGRHASHESIMDTLKTLPDSINKTYMNQASYWLKYFPFRGFLVVFDLAQVLNVLWIFFKTRMFGRTPRDIREWTQPPEFEYAIYYANLLFMAAVGLLFAPVAPLVALAAAVVFWMSSWVYKYKLMYVFVTKVETGGRLWNVVINRLLVCVLLMQALMVLTIGLQYKFNTHEHQWFSTLPPIFIILIFKMVINDKFDNNFRWYNPTPGELKSAKVHSNRADAYGHRLEHRFGHPALHAELFTPMIHADMMPLLTEVEKGRIEEDVSRAKRGEYGGPPVTVQVVEGIKIDAVAKNDLEYDPARYQRDVGDIDSIVSPATITSTLPYPWSLRWSDSSSPRQPTSPQPPAYESRQSGYFGQPAQYSPTAAYSSVPASSPPVSPTQPRRDLSWYSASERDLPPIPSSEHEIEEQRRDTRTNYSEPSQSVQGRNTNYDQLHLYNPYERYHGNNPNHEVPR